MTTTPPGWYEDGHGAMRWWDGGRWTEHVAERAAHADGESTPQATPAAAAPETGGGEAPGAVLVAPARSKLWIVWVVLGVVVLVTVVAAALVIPLLIAAASGAGGKSSGGMADDADERAAVAAVELYAEAWDDVDCDAYLASTTASFRTQSGLADCSAFESEAEAFNASAEDYEVDVLGVRTEGDEILVDTTETYVVLLDEDGAPLDEPTEESIDWQYVVVASDGGDWLIDDLR